MPHDLLELDQVHVLLHRHAPERVPQAVGRELGPRGP